jgi:hypothetical protein
MFALVLSASSRSGFARDHGCGAQCSGGRRLISPLQVVHPLRGNTAPGPALASCLVQQGFCLTRTQCFLLVFPNRGSSQGPRAKGSRSECFGQVRCAMGAGLHADSDGENTLFWIYLGARRALLHLSDSYAPPFGPAMPRVTRPEANLDRGLMRDPSSTKIH